MNDDRPDITELPWRTGRKVGRTIYAQVGREPSDDDILIGVMDRPEYALEVVAAHNILALRQARQMKD